MTPRIRESTASDHPAILAIINEAAEAYRGVIPPDRWHEPYMPAGELASEIADGVVFWVVEENGRIDGVMGIQDRGDVALVRHAYVARTAQRGGIGTRLLRHVQSRTHKPILIGTWAAATWAIDFYRRNGFTLVTGDDKDRLLRRYWSIPERQIETSVVLADARWSAARQSWIGPALLAGLAYLLIGRFFPNPAIDARLWRLAAWLLSGVVFLAHLWYERVRLRNDSPRSLAAHVAAGVALGGFSLALTGMIRSLSSGLPFRARWVLALVLWPAVTALPAFCVAYVAAMILRRRPRGAMEIQK